MGQIQVFSATVGFRANTSTSGVLGSFACGLDSLINASMSPNKVKSYQAAIALFDTFRIEKNFTLEWPASLDSIISFIAYLSKVIHTILQVHTFLVFHFISR